MATRRVVLTGASGAFGSALKVALEREGARVDPLKFGVDWSYSDYARVDARLAAADVLVLAHGSKVDHAREANCTSFLELIARYRRLRAGSAGKPEVWGLGSEVEIHPAFGNKELEIYLRSKRAFAAQAARLYRDPTLLYRHIVPAAFTSQMGPGLMSGATAVRIALFLIRRGWRYVPVTYTGLAFLNYFKFLWLGRRAAAST